MRHFTMMELTHSNTADRLGLDNTPDQRIKANLQRLCHFCLDPLRDRAGPLIVSSGFRCEELNAKVGGARNSAHIHGNGADLVSNRMSTADLVKLAIEMDKAGDILCDQIIEESANGGRTSWLHIACTEDPRHQYFRLRKEDGKIEMIE